MRSDRQPGCHNFVRFGRELIPASGGELLAVGRDVARTKDYGSEP
jgi:hypothetical protein